MHAYLLNPLSTISLLEKLAFYYFTFNFLIWLYWLSFGDVTRGLKGNSSSSPPFNITPSLPNTTISHPLEWRRILTLHGNHLTFLCCKQEGRLFKVRMKRWSGREKHFISSVKSLFPSNTNPHLFGSKIGPGFLPPSWPWPFLMKHWPMWWMKEGRKTRRMKKWSLAA